MSNDLQTISWDNSNIYKHFNDPQIEKDFHNLEEKIKYINSKMFLFENLISDLETKSLAEPQETIPLARELYRLRTDLIIQLGTASTYGSTAASVNSRNDEANAMRSRAQQGMANLNKASKPLGLFLLRAPQDYLNEFLNNDSVREWSFHLNHARTHNDYLLSVAEEVLLEGHGIDGLHAWGKLYTDLSGSLKVVVDGETMGVAKSANILFGDDRKKRETTYRAINHAWEQNEITASAILNSLSGWRLENNRARSKKKELNFLAKTCHDQKISQKTLTTLMDVTFEKRDYFSA